MAQNIMIATVDGDIYYVRNGRVPVRPSGCDPSRPMSGPAGACEWQGIHPFEDLVQIANPPQGYMQNCNTSPFNMMKDSPLVPENWAAHPYIYNDSRRPPSQRAAMVRDLLDAAHDVTAEQAIDIAFSPQVWHAELWQERIRKAAPGSRGRQTDRRMEPPQRRRLARRAGLLHLQDGARRRRGARHGTARHPRRTKPSAPRSIRPRSG